VPPPYLNTQILVRYLPSSIPPHGLYRAAQEYTYPIQSIREALKKIKRLNFGRKGGEVEVRLMTEIRLFLIGFSELNIFTNALIKFHHNFFPVVFA